MEEKDVVAMMQAHIRSQVQELTGLADTRGIELFSLLRMVMNLCEVIETRLVGENGLSGPRWALLLRLFAEEKHGKREGITPTSLSRYRSVSKNTISALLRGLEEQGLIQRALDAEDYRLFRIQLTPAGRELVQSTAPERIRHMNEMLSGLSEEECEQLIALLAKLHRSLLTTLKASAAESRGG
jgi:DNA-binding MarR family transcriptional regulator